MMVEEINFVPANLTSVPAKLVEIMNFYDYRIQINIIYINTLHRLLYFYICKKDVKKDQKFYEKLPHKTSLSRRGPFTLEKVYSRQ